MLAAPAFAQVSPGTTLVGSLDRELNSKSTQVGQTFRLLNVNSSAHDINGATIYGHVSEVQSGGAGRKAKIKLVADKLNTRSGSIYKIDGYATNVQVNTKSNTGREAGAAAAGALVGGLIGKGWGAILGGTGGFLVAKNVHENISVPQGSLVTIEVSQARKQSSQP
jgi:hypothetical protein